MDRVASKGGTTQAALDSIEGNKMKDLIKEAAAKNIPTYIGNGNKKDVILDIVRGKNVGTRISL